MLPKVIKVVRVKVVRDNIEVVASRESIGMDSLNY